MKIYSKDQNSWLTFDHNVDDNHDYSAFSLEAFIDLDHSSFQGKNIDLHFFDIDNFIAKLDAFVLDRSIQPKLEGTYDTYIMFKGNGTHIFISFSIGSAYCGTETYFYSVQGTFEVSQENLGNIVIGFTQYAGKA